MAIKLPDGLLRRLDEAARARGTTRSALVRDVLEDLLRAEGASQKASFTAQAADLAGCAEGPADLSYGKRHLRGYGR
jgi:predicted transcriptional regulator